MPSLQPLLDLQIPSLRPPRKPLALGQLLHHRHFRRRPRRILQHPSRPQIGKLLFVLPLQKQPLRRGPMRHRIAARNRLALRSLRPRTLPLLRLHARQKKPRRQLPRTQHRLRRQPPGRSHLLALLPLLPVAVSFAHTHSSDAPAKIRAHLSPPQTMRATNSQQTTYKIFSIRDRLPKLSHCRKI